MFQVKIPIANILKQPHLESSLETQALYGEQCDVLSEDNDFYYIRLAQQNDDYKGFIAKSSLATYADNPTHRVSNRNTLIFSKPDIKTPNPYRLSLGCLITIKDIYNDKFFITQDDTFVIQSHVINKTAFQEFTKEKWTRFIIDHFLNTSYLWGGRSADGIDCSGLVQLSLQQFGIFLPRDSSPQQNFLKDTTTDNQLNVGDIIFWPGHVGVMIDKDNCIHANAHHMKTIIEPLQVIQARSDREISAIKQLNP